MNIEKYSDLSQDQLVDAIKRAVGRTVHALAETADLVRAYEAAGYDMTALRQFAYLEIIRQIAHGHVSAELVYQFQGSRAFQTLRQLPSPDQKRVTQGERFDVWQYREDGQLVHRTVTAAEMEPEEVKAAFHAGRINTQAQQVSYLNSQATLKMRPARVAAPSPVTLEKKGVRINQPTFLSIAELSDLLARLTR